MSLGATISAPTAVAEAAYPAVRHALEGLRGALMETRGFVPAQSRRTTLTAAYSGVAGSDVVIGAGSVGPAS